jgi:hypothetical protein
MHYYTVRTTFRIFCDIFLGFTTKILFIAHCFFSKTVKNKKQHLKYTVLSQ